MTFTFTSEAATTTQPTQGTTMQVEMIEPTEQPATQPTQPTQGVTMDNFTAPNLVGIIMQALEQHIEAMVDKRFNERMADFEMPSTDDLKDTVTEMIDEKMSEINDEIDEKIAEAISDHTSEYDHDEYDTTVRTVDDADLADIEEKIKYVIRGIRFEANFY